MANIMDIGAITLKFELVRSKRVVDKLDDVFISSLAVTFRQIQHKL